MSRAIIWHFLDLRTEWNPALSAAAAECDEVLPIFIFDQKRQQFGEASLWWLEGALENLASEYQELGAKLCIRVGDTKKILTEIVEKTKAETLYFNASFEPDIFHLQEEVAKKFPSEVFNGNHLIDPREIEVKPGKPYSVFTPFYKASLKALEVPTRPPLPRKLHSLNMKSDPLSLDHYKWMDKLEKYWTPSRQQGLKYLKRFVTSFLSHYKNDRDYPALKGTSKLSPYLHFGQICPQEIWHAAIKGGESFTRQLFWREFGTYFLFHFPDAQKHNWNHKFDKFPWDKDTASYKKWTKGQTGYPIVDAGMRQLYETGWMHNRLRMIVASFLTKDLFINWTYGERWFWDHLLDADMANNILGWQWTAGSGPDAAPYFRIFNPILQGKRFDPHGEFVKKYIPELKDLPEKWIHTPWEAPDDVLLDAGVKLGKTYPHPIVDHSQAREEAMKRYNKIK